MLSVLPPEGGQPVFIIIFSCCALYVEKPLTMIILQILFSMNRSSKGSSVQDLKLGLCA